MMAPDLKTVIAALQDGPTEPGSTPEAHLPAAAAASAAARVALCEALPFAVAPYAERVEPHAYQQELLQLVQKTLSADRLAAEAATGVADAEVEATRARLEEAGKEEAAASAKIEEAAAAAEAKGAELEKAKAKVQEESAHHAETVATTAYALDKQSKLLEDRRKLQDLALAIEASGDGAMEVGEIVLSFLEGERAEKPLIAAAPAAFGLPLSARSAFDNLVVEEVRRMASEKSAALEAAASTGAEEARHAEAERLGAWAVQDVEKEKAAEAQVAYEVALAEVEAAKAAHKAIKAKVGSCRASTSAALVQQTLTDLKVQSADNASGALIRLMTPAPAAPEEDTCTKSGDDGAATQEEADAPAKGAEDKAALQADVAMAGVGHAVPAAAGA